jgi:hypothetical protein
MANWRAEMNFRYWPIVPIRESTPNVGNQSQADCGTTSDR